uniref:Prostaglandin E2 receptor EP4 subtype-like n=1 Tax=Crassostrea virginica TaxID=6565 RepID=A0A8B8CFL8_CRAVI|nr:prostaglandin E2 receptor EP4 subtype-like [Crassostrea virginica]
MEIVRSNDTVYVNNTNLTQLESREEKPTASIAPPIVILILGTIGNGLALILLHHLSGEHKWRVFYRFVLALTINDLLGIILTAPIGIARYASNFTFTFPPSLCDYMAFVQMFTILNSAFIVLSMSLDRFYAILFPVKYSFSAKERRAHALLILGGVVSLFVSSALHMAGRHARSFYPGSWCFVDFNSESWADRGISLVYALTGLIILSFVVILNIAVIVTIFRQNVSKGNSAMRITSSKKSTQMIFLLFAVVILFAICSAPLLINMFAQPLRILKGMESFQLLGLRLSFLNGVLNPWLYILVRRETFSFLQRIVRLCCCCNPKEEKNSVQTVTL